MYNSMHKQSHHLRIKMNVKVEEQKAPPSWWSWFLHSSDEESSALAVEPLPAGHHAISKRVAIARDEGGERKAKAKPQAKIKITRATPAKPRGKKVVRMNGHNIYSRAYHKVRNAGGSSKVAQLAGHKAVDAWSQADRPSKS